MKLGSTDHPKIFTHIIDGPPPSTYTVKVINYINAIGSTDIQSSMEYFNFFIECIYILFNKKDSNFSKIFNVIKVNDENIIVNYNIDFINGHSINEIYAFLHLALQELLTELKNNLQNPTPQMQDFILHYSLILPQRALLSFSIIKAIRLKDLDFGLISINTNNFPIIIIDLSNFLIKGFYNFYNQDLALFLTDRTLKKEQRIEMLKKLWSSLKNLDLLHNMGLVHRDIKPSNILLDTNLNPYLADLDTVLLNETIGLNSNFMGSVKYLSPEVIVNFNSGNSSLYNKYTDIYSVAVLIFETIFGNLLGVQDFPISNLLEFSYLSTINFPLLYNQNNQKVVFNLLINLICNYALLPSSVDKLFYLISMFIYTDNGISFNDKPKIADLYIDYFLEQDESKKQSILLELNKIDLTKYNEYLKHENLLNKSYTFKDLVEGRS